MDTLLGEFEINGIDFESNSSQQFATVLFDRTEDSDIASITIIRNGKINQFDGNNDYNPSRRRHSSCVYVKEECSDKTIKICTIQHKGITLVEIHRVSSDELFYLFGIEPEEA